jgi:hypothetical protein
VGAVVRIPDGRDFTSGVNELTRADLASAVLDVVADDSLARQAIEVTGARRGA